MPSNKTIFLEITTFATLVVDSLVIPRYKLEPTNSNNLSANHNKLIMERTLIYGLIFGFIDSDLKANEIHERNIIHLIAKMCFYQDKIIIQ